jgi:NAD(P)-dependent dehydrogenase (short-subunit alcohol dehydrogenase family)
MASKGDKLRRVWRRPKCGRLGNVTSTNRMRVMEEKRMGVTDLFSVQGLSTFITGAASGLGLAMAEAMAEGGARVTLADVNGDGVRMAAERLRAAGMAADAVILDVRDAAAVQAAIGETARRAGRLDVVFANAGISAGPGYALLPEGRLEAISLATWENVLKVNLTGVMLTLQAAAAAMKMQRSGRIIVTASISGLRSETVSGYGYVATKAAVINLVRHAARELGRDNILVNAIAPGYFYTNLAGGRLRNEPETARRLAATVPLGRCAEAEELKGLALFLASPASSYITGTVIPIDGGVSAG